MLKHKFFGKIFEDSSMTEMYDFSRILHPDLQIWIYKKAEARYYMTTAANRSVDECRYEGLVKDFTLFP